MYKTLLIAMREFTATVFTKGFLIGVCMTPLIMIVVVAAIGLTQSLKGARVTGTLAVIDRSGVVGQDVAKRFGKEAQDAERARLRQKADKAMEQMSPAIGLDSGRGELAKGIGNAVIEERIAKMDGISVEVLDGQADANKESGQLADVDLKAAREAPTTGAGPRVAVAVIPSEAVTAGEKGEFKGYELFTAPKLDFEIREGIERRIGRAIVDARIRANPKLAGLEPEAVRAIVDEPDAASKTVTKEGVKGSESGAQIFLPMSCMLLLLMSVMTGGQYLLTTTVEEKSSRVMEVLLSAVSPMQLMVGKILGQMTVGLLILTVYSGMAIAGLIAFSLQHLVTPMMLVSLVLFFFIAFFIIASLMAAVGSAVNDMREAQSLMSPIMIIIMLPWLLWMPISRAPNSLFSTVMSFVPGVNPFVMMIRISSSEPPPGWQVALAVLVGLLTVVACAWAASKIFRVGVLMFGKPPNLKTLVKWIRMA